MSSKVFSQEMSSSKAFMGIFLCAMLFMVGCSSKNASMMPARKYSQGSVGDAKLTAKQKEIFYKTGQLDKNLPKKALPAVAEQYSHFLNGGRRTMEVFSQRSEDYLGHARDIFRAKGMPEELAYLAIVESGYKHTAKSHAGAAGTWQFMPYTGKMYGLRQDTWLDERLDPYKSVEAAATYLKRLHSYFDDWLLAVAAYNAGEGKIGRALEATGTKDFFSLVEKNHTLSDKMQLRTETLVYVPRFLAVSKIMRNLGPLGFDTVHHERDSLHARVEVRPNTNLKGLASVSGLSWAEFREINAAHKKTTSHKSHTTYAYVPHSKERASENYIASSASRAMVAKAKPKTSKSGTYKVKSGESLSTIAHKHGISIASLRQANNMKSSTTIRVGQVLRLPKSGKSTAVASAPKSKVSKSSKKSSAPRLMGYKVKSGESLSVIAHKHGTSVAELMKLNNLSNASKVRIGQTLKVPTSKVVAQKKVHVVKYGDTVGGIALKYNLSTAQLLKINKKDSAKIREGEKLLVSMR